MQNNQQSGSSQGGHEKPRQTLSWAQPQNVQQQKLINSGTANAARPATPVKVQRSPMRPRTMFIMGIIVGALITWIWFDTRPSAQNTAQEGSGYLAIDKTSGAKGAAISGTPAANADASTSSGAALGEKTNDTISVPTPQNAGTSVAVSSISAEGAVWAVVYEDINGKVGNALGAARFTPPYAGGSIELLRSTLPNLTYFVGLTADTPDHTFSIKTNAPILGQDGNQVMTQFAAQ